MSKWSKLKFWKFYDLMIDRYSDYLPNSLPPKKDWFKAFELTPYENVKVVILGQDPYPTKGHAHGLAFSTMPHVKPLPRSLSNIFAEYCTDLGYSSPRNGDLSLWAERGVLLLNTVLTVEEGKPASHRGLGWEKLTYEVMKVLNEKETPVVFMLWGKHAQEYGASIDNPKHLVLTAAHPSPLSCKQFFGCKHFSKACEHLSIGKDFWKLP